MNRKSPGRNRNRNLLEFSSWNIFREKRGRYRKIFRNRSDMSPLPKFSKRRYKVG